MLVLTFEEFNNKINVDNNAMSDIRIKDIGKDISLTPIEIVMREKTPDNTSEPNVNIIVNLHPTDSTHWVLVIRREGGPVYFFDSFGVETPPLFLEESVDLGSNERIQQYDEIYCGAYCLYMIYLIDRGFRINNALNILVNQCKYQGIYNECFCLGCSKDLRISFANNDNVNDNFNDNDNVNDKVNDNDNDKDKVNDKDNDLLSSFTNNDIDNDNDLRSSFANIDNVSDNDNVDDNDNDNDNVNDNGNVNDNDNGNDNDNDNNDNFIYLFDEKHQKVKPNNTECLSNIISVNINKDLQSWLNDDNIIIEATLPVNFRCIISGPSNCGKTFLLKKIILARIYFDKLYIIGHTGDQYEGVESYNRRSRNSVDNNADVEFVKDIKDLPSPDQLPKDLKKLRILDDVRAKEPVINEFFCRVRHNNCNMIYLNQNLFTIDRQRVRENCNLFILFEQRVKVLISIYQDFFNNVELSYNDFANICNKVWKEPYNYIVIDITKNENFNGKLRINWDRSVL